MKCDVLYFRYIKRLNVTTRSTSIIYSSTGLQLPNDIVFKTGTTNSKYM